ncbi:hypothetical protein [Paraburkholderia heleia]|uniref:hypothetical protein n=1 Tax=Paraburkholderia heleia TaxID=634127 RepID=UPI001427C7FB|nr:hypothetical protein [Paraburkholderia heleia]
MDSLPDDRAEELATAAFVTLLVGPVEPLPVAFFPPVVFAIAIPPLAGKLDIHGLPQPIMPTRKKQKQTAENLLFYHAVQ